MEKSARTRMTTAGVLAVVFAAGLLLGMAVDRTAAGPAEPGAEATRSTREEERPGRTPMYEQVGPTEAQSVLIDSIVKELREDWRALRREYRDAYEELVEQTRESIKGVLTAEQAEQYDSLVAAYEERRRAERGSRENRD